MTTHLKIHQDPIFYYNHQRKNGLRALECLVLFFIVSLTWFFGILYYSSDLKFKFYVDSDDKFMERLDSYFNSSMKAREDMVDWLSNFFLFFFKY